MASSSSYSYSPPLDEDSTPMPSERLITDQEAEGDQSLNEFPQARVEIGDSSYLPSKKDIDDMMEKGMAAFEKSKFDEATCWYKDARDASVHLHGKFSLDSEPAYYMYGLALLYGVPIPINDPMAIVPKEADYYRGLSEDRSAEVLTTQSNGTLLNNYSDKLEAAWQELKIAWSIIENEPSQPYEKLKILSALGEVSFRKGDLDAQGYYFEALSILKGWVGEIYLRVADIHAKICICLERSNRKEAIAYGEKAIWIYQTRLKELIPVAIHSSIAVAKATDPSIQQKKPERTRPLGMMVKSIRDLTLKVGHLKKGLHQSSTSSGSLKGTSGEATLSLIKLGGISRLMTGSVASADPKDDTDGGVGEETDGNRSTSSEEKPLEKDM